jgi:hypothetical protein
MALRLSSIKSSPIDDGEWVTIPEWPDVRLKVRSLANRDYQIQRELLVQRLSKSLGRLPTSPEMEPALGKLIARFILRGWEGIAGDDDQDMPYTAEKALELLAAPDYRELEQQVIWAASRLGERDAEFTADAVKNSAAPSAGT